MSFRRGVSGHDRWRTWLEENRELLSAVPPEVVARESVFRSFATDGSHTNGEESWCLGQFSSLQIRALWKFANCQTELDMDCALFDALNRAFRAIEES